MDSFPICLANPQEWARLWKVDTVPMCKAVPQMQVKDQFGCNCVSLCVGIFQVGLLDGGQFFVLAGIGNSLRNLQFFAEYTAEKLLALAQVWWLSLESFYSVRNKPLAVPLS